MIVYNRTRRQFVASQLKIAKNVWQRFRGLLGSRELEEGEGFLIPSCKGIHTFAMAFSIDVLYLDGNYQVLAALKDFRPNLTGPVFWKAKAVLELPVGAIEKSHTQVGDFLILEETPSDCFPEPVPLNPYALPLPRASF